MSPTGPTAALYGNREHASQLAGITAKTPEVVGVPFTARKARSRPVCAIMHGLGWAICPANWTAKLPRLTALPAERGGSGHDREDMDGSDGPSARSVRLYQSLAHSGPAATCQLQSSHRTRFRRRVDQDWRSEGFVDLVARFQHRRFWPFLNERAVRASCHAATAAVDIGPPTRPVWPSRYAIGDQANGWLLEIFADIARQNGPRDRCFRIEHAQHLRRDYLLRRWRSRSWCRTTSLTICRTKR